MKNHQSTVSLFIKSYTIFFLSEDNSLEEKPAIAHTFCCACATVCVSPICAVCVSLWCVRLSVSYVCVNLSCMHACMFVCVCLWMHMSLFHVSECFSPIWVHISCLCVSLTCVCVTVHMFVWLCACTFHSAMCMCVCMTVGACILQARMVMRNGKSVKTQQKIRHQVMHGLLLLLPPSAKVSTVYFYSLLPVQLHRTFLCTFTQYIFTD